MSNIQYTPLHEKHIALGARMAPFGGWDMPIQYEGILAEHNWTRTQASIFDTCHMGEFELSGPTAEADLERLLTLDVSAIPEGRCRYGFLCREDGGVLDDLTCYRCGSDRFILVVNAGTREKDAAWIKSHCSETTRFTDRSPHRAKLDIQGPESRSAMEQVIGENLPDLPYFGFIQTSWAGHDMMISRSGYTGEWGYELYMDAENATSLWNRLTATNTIKPAGLGARDTLRLEMGYALYGHELNEERTPAGVTRGAFIKTEKPFIGHETITAELTTPSRLLVGLKLNSKRAARESDEVVSGEKIVGIVTSGSVAPSLGYAIATALVDADILASGDNLAISVRGKNLATQTCSLPFFTEGSARKRAEKPTPS